MFPKCWAIVEGESYDSWGWFLESLILDLGPDGPFRKGIGWTIISDQQKIYVHSLYYIYLYSMYYVLLKCIIFFIGFDKGCCLDYVTKYINIENNMYEVFNGLIPSSRDKLTIFMLEDIGRALMDSLEKNLPIVLANENDPIGP